MQPLICDASAWRCALAAEPRARSAADLQILLVFSSAGIDASAHGSRTCQLSSAQEATCHGARVVRDHNRASRSAAPECQCQRRARRALMRSMLGASQSARAWLSRVVSSSGRQDGSCSLAAKFIVVNGHPPRFF